MQILLITASCWKSGAESGNSVGSENSRLMILALPVLEKLFPLKKSNAKQMLSSWKYASKKHEE